MKLDAGEIKDLVSETERKRSDWVDAALVWEEAWRMHRYDDVRIDIKELDAVKATISPDPYNIIQLLYRFVASDLRVEVPYISEKDEDDERSSKAEEWLTAFEQRSHRQQGRNLINDKTWFSGVRGRGASQVLWVDDVLKKRGLQGKRLPILKRNLDPFDVGVAYGPFGTDYAYHKYKVRRSYIEQMYPQYKIPEKANVTHAQGYWKQEYTVVDFWAMHEGSVWHTVTIEHEYAKPPVKTDAPFIPIIEWYADGAPIDDELAKSLSILHPILGSWKEKCDILSKIGTGLLYYFDPLVKLKGFIDNVDVGPGATITLGPDQDVDFVRPEPNVPMAERYLGLLQQGIDQATFPGIVYGEAGGVQAGFALNNLAQQARARANIIRENIEAAMEAENELTLAWIEAMAPEEGVEIWGSSGLSDKSKPIRLTKKDIKGNYANEVRLIPEQPMDDNGKVMTWLQLMDKGVISVASMRNRGVNVPLPRDEELRVALDKAMQMPEIAMKHTLRALQKRFQQKEWELLIQGTPLQQVHEQEMQWREQKRQEEEAAKEARRLEKQQREMQEMMANMPPPPPGMMPPDMPPLLPGMGPDMSGLTMTPPTPTGQPIGMPNSEMMLGPGMPPGMSPDMNVQPPGLPGMPPQEVGQFTPDMLGIPPGAPPGQFDQMLGGEGLSEEELLRRLTGGAGTPPL